MLVKSWFSRIYKQWQKTANGCKKRNEREKWTNCEEDNTLLNIKYNQVYAHFAITKDIKLPWNE